MILPRILIEIFLQIIIPKLKKKFQWIIFPEDLYPRFNIQKFRNYLKKSYDKNLGWVRKSNIKGYDKIDNKKIEFNIYSKGYRRQINSRKNRITSLVVLLFLEDKSKIMKHGKNKYQKLIIIILLIMVLEIMEQIKQF